MLLVPAVAGKHSHVFRLRVCQALYALKVFNKITHVTCCFGYEVPCSNHLLDSVVPLVLSTAALQKTTDKLNSAQMRQTCSTDMRQSSLHQQHGATQSSSQVCSQNAEQFSKKVNLASLYPQMSC